jgi:CDP-diacylglycerol--glycerol-3-phosphate 3-phosphatidyltransferase/cardiolipin synthase
MGMYRARDLVRAPGLLSLARLPLAVGFSLSLAHPFVAIAILIAAGISDVLDGWVARRSGQVTPTGTALDPVTDKIFVTTVAVSLVVGRFLEPLDVLLLSTREVGELPLVAWLAVDRAARQRRAEHPSANAFGKLATALQFGTAAAALCRVPHLEWLVGVTAVAGVAAAVNYWLREVRQRQRGPASKRPVT